MKKLILIIAIFFTLPAFSHEVEFIHQYLSDKYYPSFKEEDDYDKATKMLKAGFNSLCGDTFCSGDYNNITTLGIQCTVKGGMLEQCLWTFAGSHNKLHNGKLSLDSQKIVGCYLNVKGIHWKSFVHQVNKKADAQKGPDLLHNLTLDGQTDSIYDTIFKCLNGKF